MDQIFVLHHPPLVDRKHSIGVDLQTLNLSATWIEHFTPPDIPDLPKNNLFKNMAEYSLFLKHKLCFEIQVKNEINRILILEDDALINQNFNGLNFNQYYEKCINEFNELNCDILFLGICCGINPINLQKNKFVYYDKSYRSRCTHCYVITLDAAKKALKYVDTFAQATDHYWNKVIEIENLRSCYANPSVRQGSEIKKWASSLR